MEFEIGDRVHWLREEATKFVGRGYWNGRAVQVTTNEVVVVSYSVNAYGLDNYEVDGRTWFIPKEKILGKGYKR